ncbi:MAG: AMP-binding protein [Novosphingobium sp.]
MTANAIHQPTLAAHFAQALTRNRDHVAIIDGDAKVTYRALAERVGKLIALFEARGYGPGHRLGVAVPMSLDYLATFMASQIAGLAFAEMPPAMPDETLLHRIASGSLDSVVVDPRAFGARARGFIEAIPVECLVTAAFEGCEAIDGLLDQLEPAPIRCKPAGEFAILSFTGGSTGLPKPQGFTGESAAALATMIMASVPFPLRPVAVVYRTGYQVMQLGLIQTLMRGGTLVTLGNFDLPEISRLGRLHRCNVLFMATRMIYTLADQQDVDWIRGQVQLIFHGGEPITPARLRSAIERFGSIFVASYGSTETGGGSAFLLPDDHDVDRPELLISSGRALPGVEIEIRDEHNRPMPAGEVGEIAVRSPGQMACYIGLPDKTAETVRDGWICTGDVGRIEENGYLYVADRTAFALESNGVKVFPRLVDAQLSEHPAVSIAVTVGIEDSVATNLICAAVTLRPGMQARPKDLQAFLAERPDAIKVDHVLIFDSFPLMAANLKINRPQLVEMVRKELARNRVEVA